MQMPFFVRSRNDGKTYELRIKHRCLPKPVYFTFDVQEDAQRASQRAIAALEQGEVPAWLTRSERRSLINVSQAILGYRAIRGVPPSLQRLLDTVMNKIGTRLLVD
jgi:hypothetical protein